MKDNKHNLYFKSQLQIPYTHLLKTKRLRQNVGDHKHNAKYY